MKKSLLQASALLVLALVPVSVGAQSVTLRSGKVNYDYDKTTNFAKLRTYALKPTAGANDPLVNERINNAIARGLALRGMRRVDDHPDVYVVPNMTIDQVPQVTAYGNGPGWGWGYYGYGGWGITTYDVNYLQYNTLVIDMLDPQSGDLVWRGRGVRQVNPRWKPDKIDKEVNEAVAKILRNFPPVPDR